MGKFNRGSVSPSSFRPGTSESISTKPEACENKLSLDEKVKEQVAQAVAVWKQEYQLEIESFRAEVIEVKTSQAFICNLYDDLKNEYDNC